MNRLQVRDAIAIFVILVASAIAWIDPSFRDKYFGIVASIVTGYFALSVPRQN
jgi:hypothetical protein